MTAAEQERVYQRHTQNVAAYELYLQGRSHLVRQNREETLAAVEAFEGALRYDPNNALAHAGLAMALPYLGRIEEAKKAARRARELAPRLTLKNLARNPLFVREADVARMLEGFRQAGLEDPVPYRVR